MSNKIIMKNFKLNKFIFIAFLLCISFSANATKTGLKKLVCSSCGKEDSYSVLMSTNQFKHGSLDTRPGEMARHAVIHKIKQCKSCGLVSYDVSKKICDKQDEIIQSNTYKGILSTENINDLSKKYQAYAYILEQCQKDKKEIFYAYLNAAWAADDEGEKDNAVLFRQKAISYLEQDPDMEEQILLLDLYRRTAQFQKALNLISLIKVDETNENACMYTGLIKHEKKLLEEKNISDQRITPSVYCPQKDDTSKN